MGGRLKEENTNQKDGGIKVMARGYIVAYSYAQKQILDRY